MRVYMSGRDSARSRRLGWARLRLIVGVGAACIWGVAQADMVVQPNSQYFSGWAFASITQPAAKPIPAGTPLVGMLGQRAFTIRSGFIIIDIRQFQRKLIGLHGNGHAILPLNGKRFAPVMQPAWIILCHHVRAFVVVVFVYSVL